MLVWFLASVLFCIITWTHSLIIQWISNRLILEKLQPILNCYCYWLLIGYFDPIGIILWILFGYLVHFNLFLFCLVCYSILFWFFFKLIQFFSPSNIFFSISFCSLKIWYGCCFSVRSLQSWSNSGHNGVLQASTFIWTRQWMANGWHGIKFLWLNLAIEFIRQ